MTSKDLLTRCETLYGALDDLIDGDMPFLDRMVAKSHLMMCGPCRAYLKQYEQVREITGKVTPCDLPPDFEAVMERVVGRWKKEGPEKPNDQA
ncbi:MAG: zf-HC2 domain-containing protein [Planctomycetota bacterium]